LNLEDNSETVKIGKAIHEEKAAESQNSEIAIDHIRLDRLTKEYLTEIKKSDADMEACRWQLLFYLKVLKEKGIVRKGRLEFIEKNQSGKRVEVLELTEEVEKQLELYKEEIIELLAQENVPPIVKKKHCKACSYYEYCYI